MGQGSSAPLQPAEERAQHAALPLVPALPHVAAPARVQRVYILVLLAAEYDAHQSQVALGRVAARAPLPRGRLVQREQRILVAEGHAEQRQAAGRNNKEPHIELQAPGGKLAASHTVSVGKRRKEVAHTSAAALALAEHLAVVALSPSMEAANAQVEAQRQAGSSLVLAQHVLAVAPILAVLQQEVAVFELGETLPLEAFAAHLLATSKPLTPPFCLQRHQRKDADLAAWPPFWFRLFPRHLSGVFFPSDCCFAFRPRLSYHLYTSPQGSSPISSEFPQSLS